nr:hypothetical protein 20 [Spirochaetaceae bacterium]
MPRPTRVITTEGYQLEGIASWYGGKFQGRLTANGEVFDTNELTAAHRELPFGTIVQVTNTDTGASVVVRINDRGPFVDNRVIDLSRAAADAIGLTATGVAPVVLEILEYRPLSTTRTIQIASFSSRQTAEELAGRLRDNGFTAAVESVAPPGVHRVIVDEVEVVDLEKTKGRLASLGFDDVLVRQE